MISKKWVQYKKNPIWVMKDWLKEFIITEDFVVIQKDKKYYAFFTYGVEKNQKLGLAIADSPLGPFKEHERKPIFDRGMRLGSVIAPCKLTNNKWRLYYCAINPHNWKRDRTINFIESDDLINWFNDTQTNLFALDGFFGQPCCKIVNNEFFMLVSKVFGDGFFVENYSSDDGINFKAKYSNPFISPKLGTQYSEKIGNPTFYDNDEINIFCEGNLGHSWFIFQSVLKKGEIKVIDEPLFPIITANPFITKFDDKYYLYYGELIHAGEENCYWQVNVAYQNVI